MPPYSVPTITPCWRPRRAGCPSHCAHSSATPCPHAVWSQLPQLQLRKDIIMPQSSPDSSASAPGYSWSCKSFLHPGEEQRDTPGTRSKGTTPRPENLGTAGVTAVLSEIPEHPSRPLYVCPGKMLWSSHSLPTSVKWQSHE